jgi:hypothetical protein
VARVVVYGIENAKRAPYTRFKGDQIQRRERVGRTGKVAFVGFNCHFLLSVIGTVGANNLLYGCPNLPRQELLPLLL